MDLVKGVDFNIALSGKTPARSCMAGVGEIVASVAMAGG